MGSEAKKGHTPGPWRWFASHDGIDLRTPDRGKLLVMDVNPRAREFRFAKRTDGMGGIMHRATDMIPGSRPVRIGFNEIDNPDARLIAAAPDLLGACKSALRAMKDNLEPGPMDGDAIAALVSAIARAEGAES